MQNHFFISPRLNHVNLYYLKDKILDNNSLADKYEALAMISKNTNNFNFDQVLQQIIEKMGILLENQKNQVFFEDMKHLVLFHGTKKHIQTLIRTMKQAKAKGEVINFNFEDALYELLEQEKFHQDKENRLLTNTNQKMYPHRTQS